MWDIFASESEENLLIIEEALLKIEKEGLSKENINLIYRALHTFKGNARVMGLTSLENVIHIAEDLMGMVRDGNILLDSEITDTLLFIVDKLRTLLIDINNSHKDILSHEADILIQRLKTTIDKYDDFVNENSIINGQEALFYDELVESEKISLTNDDMYLSIYFEMIESELEKFYSTAQAGLSGSNDAFEVLNEIISGWLFSTKKMGFESVLNQIENIFSSLENMDSEKFQQEFDIFKKLFREIKGELIVEDNKEQETDVINIEQEKNQTEVFLEFFEKELGNLSSYINFLHGGDLEYKIPLIDIIENMIISAQSAGYYRLVEVLENLLKSITDEDFGLLYEEEYQLFNELTAIEEITESNSEISKVFKQWHAEKLYTHLIKLRDNIESFFNNVNSDYTISNEGYSNVSTIIKLFHYIYNSCVFYELEQIAEISLSLKDIFMRVENNDSVLSDELFTVSTKFIEKLGNTVDTLGYGVEPDLSDLLELLQIAKDVSFSVNTVLEDNQTVDYILENEFKDVLTPENKLLLNECLLNNYSIYLIDIELEKFYEESLAFYQWLKTEDIKTITSITDYKGEQSWFRFMIASKLSEGDIKDKFKEIIPNLNYTLDKKDLQTHSEEQKYSYDLENKSNESELEKAFSEKENSSNHVSEKSFSNITTDKTFLKINSEKVNNLMELVGELSLVTGSLLTHQNLRQSMSGEVQVLAKSLEVLLKELQEETSNLRLVPISDVFKRMQRLIRDLEKETGKKVNLITEGDDTEIDKFMIEKLYDPLVHLLRNSIDHGIENEKERVSKGKKTNGKIKLKAMHQGGEIIISVEDDGKGLNKEKILKQAMKSGLIEKDDIIDEKIIFNFIFHAGFSTAEKLSQLSGRGVGMDVVKHNIDELRGRVTVESKENIGTKIKIHLPLTLSFIEGMVVTVNNKIYAIPIVSVSEVFKIDRKKITVINANKSQVIRIREKLIPICNLQIFYNENEKIEKYESQIIVVVNTSLGMLAIPVDKLIGNQQITLKPLTGYLKDIKAGAGCGLLNSGDVAIVLDCERLYAN